MQVDIKAHKLLLGTEGIPELSLLRAMFFSGIWLMGHGWGFWRGRAELKDQIQHIPSNQWLKELKEERPKWFLSDEAYEVAFERGGFFRPPQVRRRRVRLSVSVLGLYGFSMLGSCLAQSLGVHPLHICWFIGVDSAWYLLWSAVISDVA